MRNFESINMSRDICQSDSAHHSVCDSHRAGNKNNSWFQRMSLRIKIINSNVQMDTGGSK